MLSFKWEWISADGVSSEELAATFARLQIDVGDDCITLVEDRQTRSSRRAVTVSLYPLAEWVVFNWWFLRAGRANQMSKSPDARYSVRASGDGFIWPNLKFFPEGSETRLMWQRDKYFGEFSTLRYLAHGDARIYSTGLEFVLTNFVSNVVERLDEMSVKDTALQTEWSALRSLDEEEREFCIASARLGLDPFTEGLQIENAIIEASTRLPPGLLASFYDAANPDNIGPAIAWVEDSLSESQHQRDMSSSILATRHRVLLSTPTSRREPWRIGWEQAAIVRDSLKFGIHDPFDVGAIVKPLTHISPDVGLRAAGLGGASPSNIVVIGKNYPERALRFTLARALWHLLAADSSSYLVTSAHTEAQRIERAFAAELLAPAAGIAESIGALETVEDEDLESIADAYGVDTTVVQHQLRNQILAPLGSPAVSVGRLS